MLEAFEDSDRKQLRYTEAYLRAICISDKIIADKLESFCNRWAAAETAMVQKGSLTTAELAIILIDLLPPGLLAKGVQGTDLDRSKMQTMMSSPVLKNLRKEASSR